MGKEKSMLQQAKDQYLEQYREIELFDKKKMGFMELILNDFVNQLEKNNYHLEQDIF